MANTTKMKGKFIHIIPDGTTDWYLADSAVAMFQPTGVYVRAISFKPSGNNDVIVVREAGGPTLPGTMTDGAIIFHNMVVNTNDDRVMYFNAPGGQKMYPYIDASECTFSNAANAIIMFTLA